MKHAPTGIPKRELRSNPGFGTRTLAGVERALIDHIK